MKNPGIVYFRFLLILISFASGIGCAAAAGIPADSLTSAGMAIGLGIISGMCFLAAAITFLRRDQ